MIRRARPWSATALATLLSGAGAPHGQELLDAWEGGAAGDGLGTSLAGLGDADGDGFADVALAGRGLVEVRSGADGTLLWSAARGKVVAGPGDLDGDGLGDLLVGTGRAAFALAGADGAPLGRWLGEEEDDEFGAALAGVGDLNGDGFPDVAIGAPGAGGGRVYVYAGGSGARLGAWDGGGLFGASVSGAGDFDGDGVPDVAVGAPAPGGAGYLSVFSGADGGLLFGWTGARRRLFGGAVAGAGDVDGDGYADVAVGAVEQDCRGASDCGRFDVYAGPDGERLLATTGSEPDERLGTALAGVGDVDRDGHPELAVGGGRGVQLFAADESAPLWTFASGPVVAAAGDVDGDGHPDLLVGDPDLDGPAGAGAGRVELRSGLGRVDASGPCLVSCPDARFAVELAGANPETGAATLELALTAPVAASLLVEEVAPGPYAVARELELGPDLLPAEQCPATLAFAATLTLPSGAVHSEPFTAAAVERRTGVGPVPEPAAPPLVEGWLGEDERNGFGGAVAGGGDVDGDGRPDLVIGAPRVGSVYVYSGASGELARLWLGREAEFGGALDVVADADGDGRDEVLVGAPGAECELGSDCGAAYLYSGSGSLLRRWPGAETGAAMGRHVAAAGDLDGDGAADVAVAAPHFGASDAGRIYAYSGAGGAVLWSVDGARTNDALGRVAGAGDVDGDGFSDLVVGEPDAGFFADDADRLAIRSGADGGLVWEVVEERDLGTGFTVAGLGDVDGDGVPDVAAGRAAGGVAVFSGADGTRLREREANDETAVAAVGDVDGDGVQDLAVGGAGLVELDSGASGTTVAEWRASAFRTTFGDAVAGAGDVDGDGRPDVLVGRPGHDLEEPDLDEVGSAYLYSGNVGAMSLRGSCLASCSGGRWTYQVRGVPRTAGTASVALEVAEPERRSLLDGWTGAARFAVAGDIELPALGTCPERVLVEASLADGAGARATDTVEVRLVETEGGGRE